jgi:hypothetical protein
MGDKRRSSRLNVELRVAVWGINAANRPFTQYARTIDISVHGIRISGMQCLLKVGDIVGVGYRRKKARFKVVSVGKLGTPQFGQVALEAVELKQNLWDLDSERLARSNVGTGERRSAPRYRCGWFASIVREGTKGTMGALMADVSGSGCYIEIETPLPVGAVVSISFDTGDASIYATGEVKTSHSGVGMGIKFTHLDVPDRQALGRALRRLSQASMLGPQGSAGRRVAAQPSFD